MAGLWGIIPSMGQTDGAMNNQLKMLLQFNGYWETDAAIMQSGGKEYKFAYRADFKTTTTDHGIVIHEWATIPGVGRLDGQNLAGVNMFDGKIHWFSIDNMGTAHEHTGMFTDDKHFSMQYKGMQEGKEFTEILEIELTDPNTLHLKQVATSGGEQVVMITGTFHRTKIY